MFLIPGMVSNPDVQTIENTPYVQENLGVASLVNYYHKSYFHINLSTISKQVQTCIANVYFLSLKNKNHTLYVSLENSLISLQEKFNLLTHHRSKRSLFDGFGTTIRYITGNLDQNDLKDIMSNMQILRNNENKIASQNTKTLSLLLFMQQKFENISNEINTQLLQVSENINHLNEEVKIQEIILGEIFNVKNLESYLNKLLNIISFSTTEGTNLLIMDTSDIVKLEKSLTYLFSSNESIPMSKLYYFEFMNLCKLNTIISDNEIIFVLKIPIVYNIVYNYQRLYPVLFNKSNLLIIPNSYVLEDKDIYFLEEPCIKLSIDRFVCYKLLTNECNLRSLEKCIIVNTNNYSNINTMENNQLLINTNQKLNIFEHCNKTQIIIDTPSIIRNYCEISTLGNTYIYKESNNFTIKIPSVDLYDFKVEKLKFTRLENYHSIKNKIENLQHKVDLESIRFENRSMSITIYIVILLLCIIYLVYRYRTKICNLSSKRRNFKENDQFTPLQTIQVVPSLTQEIQA